MSNEAQQPVTGTPLGAVVCSAKYAAVLLLAREMAMELRMRCNDEIHHEQLAEILRLMDEAGVSANDKAEAPSLSEVDPPAAG